MAVLKFDAFRVNEAKDGCITVERIEFDTDVESAGDQQRMINDVLELHKDKNIHVAPHCNESAWVLMKRKTRGIRVEVAPEVVKFVHERYVNFNDAFARIPLEVYKEFGLELSENIIKAILKQDRDTEVPGFNDLRTVAANMSATRTRRKYSDEDKEEWVRLHVEDGLSGTEIAKEYGINNAVVNGHLNKVGVQRNGRGRKKIEVAEEIS